MPMRYDLLFFLTICEVAWPTLEAHRQGKTNYKALVCNANQSRAWDKLSLLSAARTSLEATAATAAKYRDTVNGRTARLLHWHQPTSYTQEGIFFFFFCAWTRLRCMAASL